MTEAASARRPIAGWREWVGLPELGIARIKAKVDTGARSSALHAYDVSEHGVDGETRVRFRVHPVQRDVETEVVCSAPLVEHRWVRSSSGRASERPVVRTLLTLGEEAWEIELTLVRRDLMGFRMLLGRQAVRGRYLVDPGRSYLAGGRPAKRRRRESGKRRRPAAGQRTGNE